MKIGQGTEKEETYNKKNNKFKILIVATIFIFLISSFSWRGSNYKQAIYFLDVGQGDSTLIQDGEQVFIIDGGGDRFASGTYNKGKEVLLPFLLDLGINHVDTVFITHLHFDHMKGIEEIIGLVSINSIVLPKVYEPYCNKDVVLTTSTDNFIDQGDEGELLTKLLVKSEKHHVEIRFMDYHDQIVSEHFLITCIYPYKNYTHKDNENNNSLVLRVDNGDFSCVLTGDVEEEGEKWLVLHEPLIEDINIVKVPHHGSNSSSSEEFLEKLNPDGAIVSVGKNLFGHPSDIIHLRYKNRDIPFYSTQKYGMIEVRLNSDGYHMNAFKGDLINETIARSVKE